MMLNDTENAHYLTHRWVMEIVRERSALHNMEYAKLLGEGHAVHGCPVPASGFVFVTQHYTSLGWCSVKTMLSLCRGAGGGEIICSQPQMPQTPRSLTLPEFVSAW